MDVQNAIETALLKAAGDIPEERDRALANWIKTASRADYEHFAEECALAFSAMKADDVSFKVPPEEISKEYDSLCRHLGIGVYAKRKGAVVPLIPRKLWWVAAAVVAVCIAGLYWITGEQESPRAVVVQETPVYQKPTIILEDEGRTKISLEAPDIETTPASEFVTINSMDSWNRYPHPPSVGIEGRGEIMNYRVVAVPPGKRYELKLPDGSTAWLNAGSAIHYPARFSKNARKVWLVGEVFFEVVKNDRLFEVESNGKTVQVFGTRFNMRAYPDETEMKVTLLEGSVRVRSGASDEMLEPGQQAIVRDRIIVTTIDTAYVTAWKRGLFDIWSANRYQIMKELQRWYGVEVVYNGMVPPGVFSIKASRQLKLEHMLMLLDKAGIKTSLEGDTVTLIR